MSRYTYYEIEHLRFFDGLLTTAPTCKRDREIPIYLYSAINLQP